MFLLCLSTFGGFVSQAISLKAILCVYAILSFNLTLKLLNILAFFENFQSKFLNYELSASILKFLAKHLHRNQFDDYRQTKAHR